MEHDENFTLQQEEITVLEAIFQNDFASLQNGFLVKVSPNLPQDVEVEVVDLQNNSKETVKMHALSPLELRCIMPRLYPLESCLDVEIHCDWLDEEQKALLLEKLYELWQDLHGPVLFNFTSYITEDALNDLKTLQDNVIVLKRFGKESASALLDSLASWDRQDRRRRFLQQDFDCGVCLSTKKGSQCMKFHPCNHVYCINCLRGYFNSMLEQNMPEKCVCPHLDCTKSPGRLSEVELKSILDQDYIKYQQLLEKKELEARRDVAWCPRPWCQGPAFRDAKLDRLASCRDCGFNFCAVCLKSWHGKSWCNVKSLTIAVESYLEAKEKGETKKMMALESRYGQKLLTRLLADYMDERETLQWKKENTSSCPTCSLNVQRSEGCNHMTCPTCKTHFCFLCGSWLNPDSPYKHFNDPSSQCNQKLFHGSIIPIVGDDGENGDEVREDFNWQDMEGDIPAEHIAWALNIE